MNKKGFTLVELLAAIAILGILALVATPAIISIRRNVLNNTLKSKIETVHSAALEYGFDNINEIPQYKAAYKKGFYKFNDSISNGTDQCFWVKIGTLIEERYLNVNSSGVKSYNAEGKEETILFQFDNPLNGESLNDKFVCIRFDSSNPLSREIVTYIEDECCLYTDDSLKKACFDKNTGGKCNDED